MLARLVGANEVPFHDVVPRHGRGASSAQKDARPLVGGDQVAQAGARPADRVLERVDDLNLVSDALFLLFADKRVEQVAHLFLLRTEVALEGIVSLHLCRDALRDLDPG